MSIKKPYSSLLNILPEEILSPDFARVFAQVKSARRADRLNPVGFNLVRRGNPKQISNPERIDHPSTFKDGSNPERIDHPSTFKDGSNPERIGLPIPYKEGANAKFGLKLYAPAGILISAGGRRRLI